MTPQAPRWLSGLLGSVVPPWRAAQEADLVTLSREMLDDLEAKVMPYWLETSWCRQSGGYHLDDPKGSSRSDGVKSLVGQSRMLWGFSHAAHKNIGGHASDCLEAATSGYRFIDSQLLDAEHGGYFWTVDREGRPWNTHKLLYGQVFAVLALVEYFRASGDRGALDRGIETFHCIQKRSHDDRHGGWREHFTRDWRPVLEPTPGVEVEVPGMKSANTHAHVMEAFTELLRETRDDRVRAALDEVLEINARYFYPPAATDSAALRLDNWGRPPRPATTSYGHDVECAWLMVEAERALGRSVSWGHCTALVDHALDTGFDWRYGGLYVGGPIGKRATDRRKVWWAAAELVAALSTVLEERPNERYERALVLQLDFLRRYQIDSRDGIWLDTLGRRGNVLRGTKAHSWKAAYHDLRASVILIETFCGDP